jgi:ABC-type glycerol-3-phosphate transport system permease component
MICGAKSVEYQLQGFVLGVCTATCLFPVQMVLYGLYMMVNTCANLLGRDSGLHLLLC